MPARLAAMPRTPLARGAATGAIGARASARLTTTACRTTTGAGAGGLTTPVKPMCPYVWAANGAWAAAGTATATAVLVMAWVVGVAAEAGNAREATIAPEITITAEALLAGLTEREIAEEKDEVELTWLGARWRPVPWDVIFKKPSMRLRGQLSDSDGRLHPAFARADRRKSYTTEKASPQERLATPQIVGPPLLSSGC